MAYSNSMLDFAFSEMDLIPWNFINVYCLTTFICDNSKYFLVITIGIWNRLFSFSLLFVERETHRWKM